jgi:hypothetical protein
MGDWREVMILVDPACKAHRLYTTTIPIAYRLATLLHDLQYRLSIA